MLPPTSERSPERLRDVPKVGNDAAEERRDQELLAEPGEGADLVEELALGLGQPLERDGPAAAAEERDERLDRQVRSGPSAAAG